MKLFINYRRNDTDDFAGRLYDRLSVEFGAEQIFKDVDSIRPGQDWKVVLENSVAGCDVVLALIGERWVSFFDDSGQPRKTGAEDYLRFELETAFRYRKMILPVKVKGAKIPPPEQLPESLRRLVDFQITELRGDPYFGDDVKRLMEELKRVRDRLAQAAAAAPAAGGSAPAAGGSVVDCPGCRRVCASKDQFCDNCGTALWSACPKCTVAVPAARRHCASCGVDVAKYREAVDLFESLRARLVSAGSLSDPHARARAGDDVLHECRQAQAMGAVHPGLAELHQSARTQTAEAYRQAAKATAKQNRLSEAVRHLERIRELGGHTATDAESIEKVRQHREKRLREAAALASRGEHQPALALLTQLQSAFPEDAEIAAAAADRRQVADRVAQLLSTRVNELKTARKFMELDRELQWLASVHAADEKMRQLAAAVRERVEKADAALQQAVTAAQQGNSRSAGKIAADVLQRVADHEGAQDILRWSEGHAEDVAHLEELVRLRQWCTALDLLRRLEQRGISDPRLAKLAARTRAQVAQIDSSIRILFITIFVLGLLVAVGIPVALGLLESQAEEFIRQMIVCGGLLGGAAGLTVVWWSLGEKGQILQRMLGWIIPRRRDWKIRTADESARSREPAAALSGSATAAPAPAGRSSAEDLVITDFLQAAAVTTPPPLLPEPASPAQQRAPAGAPAPTKPPVFSAADTAAPPSFDVLERTAALLEWLVLGGLAWWSAGAVWAHVSPAIESWWSQTVGFALQMIALFLIFIFVTRRLPSRASLFAALAATVVIGLSTALFPAVAAGFVVIAAQLAFLGILATAVLETVWWKGGCAAIGGPVAGSLLASPVMIGAAIFLGLLGSFKGDNLSQPHMESLELVLVASLLCCLAGIGLGAPKETIVRWLGLPRPAVAAVLSIGLGWMGCTLVAVVVLSASALLNPESLWLTRWGLYLCGCVAILAAARGRFGMRSALIDAGFAGAAAVVLALFEWLWRGSIWTGAAWTVSILAVAVLCSETASIYVHGRRILEIIRARMTARWRVLSGLVSHR